MLENRHLLTFCLVCGVVGSYFISTIVFALVFIACVVVFVIDPKFLEQRVTILKVLTFPVPWIKSIIISLMNSYHLSKPLDLEPNSRRCPPYSPNASIPRRQSFRSGRYTCSDENADYANRRNGIGLYSHRPAFNNYANSNSSVRRHSGFSGSENSLKLDEFSTSPTSPWTRGQNYNGKDLSTIRRVQTVAGPLLVASGLTKRRSNDFGLYVDANSPGLASRIVQYKEESTSPRCNVWTHQPQYSSPGQFPMVHLSPTSPSLPVLSPLSSQKASRRSVTVKIAAPDPLGSRLYPVHTKSNESYATLQADHSTKSVLETLKEISRKRIHSQLEDSDDDIVKRQKRSTQTDVLQLQSNNDLGDTENLCKRVREESSPRQGELSPPARPAKRVRNNEISSSLSSSRVLLQGGGVKRKTHSLDWSRCSTPVQEKHQKTQKYEDEAEDGASVSAQKQKSPAAEPLMLTAALEDAREQRHAQKVARSRGTKERRSIDNKTTAAKAVGSPKEAEESAVKDESLSLKSKKKTKIPSSILDDIPWRKESPFVTVMSPDDIIDDIDALEEKREEDRRSRLMSMMAVISGGEPPVKTAEDEVATTTNSAFSLGNVSSSPPVIPSNLVSSSDSEKPAFGSANLTGWSSPASSNPKLAVAASPLVLELAKPTPPVSLPTFSFGSTPSSLGNATPVATVSSVQPVTPTATAVNTPLATAAVSTFTPISSQPTPSASAFGSPQLLFGAKTENNPLLPTTTTSGSGSGNVSFGLPKQGVFGATAASPAPEAVSSAETPVQSSAPSPFQTKVAPQANVPSSGEFAMPTSSTFNKPIAFGVPEKSGSNTISTPSASPTLFGALSTSAPSPLAFGSGTPSTPQSSQNNLAMFSFGTSPASGAGTVSSPANPVFGSTAGGLGKATGSLAESNQPAHAQPATSKVGGFSFELVPGKSALSPAKSQPPASTIATASVFGNLQPTTTTPTFGNTQPTTATPTFGNIQPITATPTFGNSQPTSVFGNIQPTGPTPSFGNVQPTTTTPVFGNSQPVTTTPTFGNVQPSTTTLGFGSAQPATTTHRFGNAQPATTTPPFGNAQPATSTPVFGNPQPVTTSATKIFSFGSSKPMENPFAINASNSASPAPQATLFGTPSSLQKQNQSNQNKENLFAFGGGSSAVPSFPSAQPPATTSTAPGASSTGGVFSFSSSSAPGGFGQVTTGATAFAMASTAPAPAAPTSTSAAANAPATFAFGGGAGNQAPQSNPFAFGASASTSSAPQASNLFSFGNNASSASPSGGGIFGQAQSAAPAQTSAQTAAAFQFGSSANTQPASGTFNFGQSPAGAAGASTGGGFSASGSFQMNAGGFGGGNAMFSIGSGSTAPRVRNTRTRRTK